MKNMFLLVFALSLGVVSCKGISGENNIRSNTLESLYSVGLSESTLDVTVKSNGCTSAEDFIVVLDTESEFAGLSVIRTKVDRCKRMPKLIELKLSVEALNLDSNQPLKLTNPLVVKNR